jgi:2-hydroxychromene-2-carboxylate isomerase
MRACIYADEQNLLEPFAGRIFELYWSQDRDIQTDETLRDAAEFAGLDAEQTLVASTALPYKDALRANTTELVERGGFGSPTIFVGGDDMYFGNDRMPLIRTALFA